MTRSLLSALALTFLLACSVPGAGRPEVQISNQAIRATLYLPDARTGFYRGVRFDWSGVIASLEYQGHNYYGPWFTKFDPAVSNFSFKDGDVVAGPASAMTGPAEEFRLPLGFDAAKSGQTFVKVGVGALRKTNDSTYTAYIPFEIVDPGKWTVHTSPDSVEFIQELNDKPSGYGYVYRKIVRLVKNRPEMVIEHSLKNIGRLAIQTNVYDHNFLVLDKLGPNPDFSVTAPFEIKPTRPLNSQLAAIHGNRIDYVKPLDGEDQAATSFEGFGKQASDYDFRVENSKVGVGYRVRGDRPLSRVVFWSIRTVLAIEPYIDIQIATGQEFTWSYTYTYGASPLLTEKTSH